MAEVALIHEPATGVPATWTRPPIAPVPVHEHVRGADTLIRRRERPGDLVQPDRHVRCVGDEDRGDVPVAVEMVAYDRYPVEGADRPPVNATACPRAAPSRLIWFPTIVIFWTLAPTTRN